MRELKCGLNLPIVIGQTLSFLVANPGPSRIGPPNRGDRTLRFPVVISVSRELLFSLVAHIQPLFSQ